MADREGIMLAKPYEERLLRRFKLPYLIQPKLNGLRCRVVPRMDGKGYMLLSSSATQVTGTPHLLEQMNQFGREELELDGEFYIHGEPLKYIQGIVKRTVNLHPEHERMNLYLFDIINDATQAVRLDTLRYILKDFDRPSIIHVPVFKAQSYEEVIDILADVLSQGFEGIVIRDAWAFYERKKSFNLLKLKPEKDDFYLIVGYKEEISIHGESKGRLGSVWCEDADGTRFYVGSGFDADERETLWADKEALIDKICHVKYTELNPNNKPTEAVAIDILDINDVQNKMGITEKELKVYESKQFNVSE